jgi:hypothetical protein
MEAPLRTFAGISSAGVAFLRRMVVVTLAVVASPVMSLIH